MDSSAPLAGDRGLFRPRAFFFHAWLRLSIMHGTNYASVDYPRYKLCVFPSFTVQIMRFFTIRGTNAGGGGGVRLQGANLDFGDLVFISFTVQIMHLSIARGTNDGSFDYPWYKWFSTCRARILTLESSASLAGDRGLFWSRILSFQAGKSSVFLLFAAQSARLSIIRGTKRASFYHSWYTECVFLSRGSSCRARILTLERSASVAGDRGLFWSRAFSFQLGCVFLSLFFFQAGLCLSMVASFYDILLLSRWAASIYYTQDPPAGRGS